MVAERSEDFDILGIADDELEAAVQLFFVRKGRVVGRKGFIIDKVEDLTAGELVGVVLERLYDDPPLGIPKTVYVPTEADETELYERSEEHTSELQSLMRISYAVFCLKKKKNIV